MPKTERIDPASYPDVRVVPYKRRDEAWHEEQRRKALAPTDANRKRARYCITVPDHVMAVARKAGHGNASKGIELALNQWDEMTGTRKRGPKVRKLEKRRGPK